MAKKPFDLGDYLKAEPVSGLNTEQIVRIPLDRIDPDPNNFYSLQGIEELAGNIELVGLLDALRVRPRGEKYVIVSGHRRREAIRLIAEGGSHMFDAGVPCIVEYGEASDAMRELRLIYANSATRVMSAADLSKQAERVTQLLYELKEQGVEFPGRMRDHVAQACQVSASKIARLHAIRSNLRDFYRLFFDNGELPEGSAYRISQETPEVQKELWKRLGASVNGLSGEKLEAVIDQVKKPKEAKPEAPAMDPGKDHTDAAVDEYLRHRAEEDDAFFEMLNEEADHFFYRMAALPARHEGIARLKEDFGRDHHGWLHDRVDVMCSPKGVRLWDINGPTDWDITRTWYDVYDMLCAIALARVAAVTGDDEEDEEEEQEPVSNLDTPAWQTGTPQRNGRYYCRIRFADSPEDGGRVHEQRGEWRDGGWWFFGEPEKYGIQVVGWWPLPDEERWK